MAEAANDAAFLLDVPALVEHVLRISHLAAEEMLVTAAESRLGRTLPETLLRVCNSDANDQVDETLFYAMLRRVCEPAALADRDLRAQLEKVFASACESEATAPRIRLLMALAIFCEGSKSAKLSFGFYMLCDEVRGDFVRVEEVAELFRGVLVAIFTLANERVDEELLAFIQTVVGALADDMASYLGKEELEFEGLANWYNARGHARAPWIDLLDLSKWLPYERDARPVVGQSEEEWLAESRFEFVLSFEVEHTLSFSNDDVDSLLHFVQITGFEEWTPLGLCQALAQVGQKAAASGITSHPLLLSRQSFMEFLSSNANVDDESAYAMATRFFDAFTLPDQAEDVVPLRDFAVGLTVFCVGSKSEKLANAFSLFDREHAGSIGRMQAWRLFRSMSLMMLRLKVPERPAAEADAISRWITNAIMNMKDDELIGRSPQHDSAPEETIGLDDLAEWYAKGGYRLSAWLELLDIEKWRIGGDPIPGMETAEIWALMAARDRLMRSADNKLMNQLDIPLLDGKVTLSLQKTDIERAQNILCNSGLPAYDPVRLRELIDGIAIEIQSESRGYYPSNWRVIPRDKWEELIRSLIPTDVLSASDLKAVLSFLSDLYGVLARGEDVEVVYRFGLGVDIALSGLITLGGGSKSVKLAELVSACKDPRTEKVPPVRFERVLRAILTSLATFTSGDRREHLFANEQENIVAVAGECTRRVIDGHSGADMEALKDFYNAGGAGAMTWLELLDLAKWIPAVALALSRPERPVHTMPAPVVEPAEPAEPAELAEPEEEQEPVPEEPPQPPSQSPQAAPVPSELTSEREVGYEFSIEQSSPPLYISLHSSDIRALKLLVKTVANSMLRLVLGWLRVDRHSDAGAAAVFEHIKKQVLKRTNKEDGLLEKSAFDASVQVLVDIDELETAQQGTCAAPLESMFKSFDRNKAGSIDAKEFLIAYSLLCGGSKSAKLAFAFDVLDDKRAGQITRRELWRFFRSFLTGLSAFSLDSTDNDREEKVVAIDAAAIWTATQVFENAQEDENCSFNDIATWYGEEGYRTAPWLELLDLRKWIQEDS